jgi:sulfur carrier protein ThiS adenylyltransferase
MMGAEQAFFAKHDEMILPLLRRATIGIAGAGGLGSNVACCLVRAGVGRLVFADFDVVEPSNLNRQQFFLDQIGSPKVVALEENLKRISPFTVYEGHRVMLDGGNVARIFSQAHILVEALDDVAAKTTLIDAWVACFPARPVIVGSGIAGYGGNNEVRSQRLFDQVYACGDGCSDTDRLRPMAPKVALVAAMQANLVLELLAPKTALLQQT